MDRGELEETLGYPENNVTASDSADATVVTRWPRGNRRPWPVI
jgi:hypothetical protein